MEMAWIKHPTLPGQETEVPEQSLPHWQRSGWSRFTPKSAEATEMLGDDEDDTTPEQPAEEVPASTPEPLEKRATTSRRATSVKGDEK